MSERVCEVNNLISDTDFNSEVLPKYKYIFIMYYTYIYIFIYIYHNTVSKSFVLSVLSKKGMVQLNRNPTVKLCKSCGERCFGILTTTTQVTNN